LRADAVGSSKEDSKDTYSNFGVDDVDDAA